MQTTNDALAPVEQSTVPEVKDPLFARMEEADNDALGEMYISAQAELIRLLAEAEPHRKVLAACEEIWTSRLRKRNATTIPHDGVRIELVDGKKPDPTKLIDVLWQLRSLKIDGQPIPEAELNEALYLEPPAPEVLRRKVNLTKLKGLVKKYGTPVRDIFEKGVIYPKPEETPKRLVVEVKPERLASAMNAEASK